MQSLQLPHTLQYYKTCDFYTWLVYCYIQLTISVHNLLLRIDIYVLCNVYLVVNYTVEDNSSQTLDNIQDIFHAYLLDHDVEESITSSVHQSYPEVYAWFISTLPLIISCLQLRRKSLQNPLQSHFSIQPTSLQNPLQSQRSIQPTTLQISIQSQCSVQLLPTLDLHNNYDPSSTFSIIPLYSIILLLYSIIPLYSIILLSTPSYYLSTPSYPSTLSYYSLLHHITSLLHHITLYSIILPLFYSIILPFTPSYYTCTPSYHPSTPSYYPFTPSYYPLLHHITPLLHHITLYTIILHLYSIILPLYSIILPL